MGSSRFRLIRLGMLALVIAIAGCCANDDNNTLIPPSVFTPPVAGPLTVRFATCLLATVPTNQRLIANFSSVISATTLNATTFQVTGPGGTVVPGTLSLDATGMNATFTPAAPLTPNTAFTLTITPGVQDVAGGALALPFVCAFTTGAGADVTPPTVIATFPVCGSAGVPIDRRLSVTFSEPLDPLTIDAASFTVTDGGGTAVAGTVTYDPTTNVATFTPAANLAPGTTFTITIAATVTDLAGNALAAPFPCGFTTGTTPSGLAPVNTPCPNFTILAGSTVTNTGMTSITGNLGLSPGTSVTGFPPGVITGVFHVANGPAADGKTLLTAALIDAQSRPGGMSVSGDLVGRTLTPGVYTSTSTLALTGNVTLDAQGDPNAVFIFQIASTLITGSGSQVVLLNGARSENIFWAVGSSATLGTNSRFSGVIMADQSITLTTGARLDGCALARIGAVTLDSNIVTGDM